MAMAVTPARERRPAGVLPGVLLGLGLAGLLDAIVLHQLLGWHHADAARPGGRADGVFALVAWLVTFTACTAMLAAWHHGRLAPSLRAEVGLLVAGVGSYLLLDDLVLGRLLGLHHVRDDLGGPASWDVAAALFGVAAVAAGASLHAFGSSRREVVVVQVQGPLSAAVLSRSENHADRA